MSGKTKNWLFQNSANFITIFGLITSFWFLVVAITAPNTLWLLLLLAALTGLTDFFDGKIARYLNIKTTFGSALDRIRDKLFICPALIILAWQYWSDSKMTITVKTFTETVVGLLVLLEILLTYMCFYGVVKKLNVAANEYGKRKMFCQFLVVMFWLISLNIEKYWNISILDFSIYFIDFVILVALYFGLKSLEGYYKRYSEKTTSNEQTK